MMGPSLTQPAQDIYSSYHVMHSHQEKKEGKEEEKEEEEEEEKELAPQLLGKVSCSGLLASSHPHWG